MDTRYDTIPEGRRIGLRPHRRGVLLGLAALPFAALPLAGRAGAADLPAMVTYKDPSCGCCGAWVDIMRAAGFPVSVVEVATMNRVKARLGVPGDLASCHTALVDGYLVEGHVPPDAVKRMLAEKPRALGLAVPGMPVGSPGMGVEGVAPDTYDVVLFGPAGRRTFARYTGGKAM